MHLTKISKYSELNETLFRTYLLAVSKKYYPDGTIIAIEIAAHLTLDDFKASTVHGLIIGSRSTISGSQSLVVNQAVLAV